MPQVLGTIPLLKGYRFRIELDGVDGVFAYANEITGFDAEYDVAEYRAGDDALFTVSKYPGLAKYSNVIIKQCLVKDNSALYDLVGASLEGDASTEHKSIGAEFKKKLTITLMDDSGADAASWELSNAWAVRYVGPDLNSTVSEISIETIELAHEGLRRIAGGGGEGGEAGA